jgi:type 1 fimbria pilin
VRFTDIRGDDKTCSCEASLGAILSANCEVDINDNSCTVDLPDGTKKIFNDGDVIGHNDMPTHCGTNYPCFVIAVK